LIAPSLALPTNDNSKLVASEENSLLIKNDDDMQHVDNKFQKEKSLVSKRWVEMVLEKEASHFESCGHGDLVQTTRRHGRPSKNASKVVGKGPKVGNSNKKG